MELNGSHPVASAAARLCRERHGRVPIWRAVACDECWYNALMWDKEAAADAELPEVCPADPDLIDEVAVAQAVAGSPVELTVAEWQEAKRALMHRRQICLQQARFRLSRNVTVVDSLGNPLDPPMLGAASRGISPVRVVILAAAHRARRREARRTYFATAAQAALGRNRAFGSGPPVGGTSGADEPSRT